MGDGIVGGISHDRRSPRLAVVAALSVLAGLGLTMVLAGLFTARPSNAAPITAPSSSETVSGSGYTVAASDGGIFTFGNARFYGSMGGHMLNAPIVGVASTSDGGGYWEVARDGGIFNFGDAAFAGSMGGQSLNRPIVGLASTPDGGGYWEVASDGGIFSFGDASFFGSMGGHPLNQPIVAMATTPDGAGYWEVASDGGIFSFGDAGFFGSMGGHPLNQPIVGIASTPDGGGYWEVASDGGIFNFGDAKFYGSMGDHVLNQPIVSVTAGPDGAGYWEVAKDGGVFSFGAAPAENSLPGLGISVDDVVGIALPAASPVPPKPALSSVSPASGPEAGGNTVTLMGSGFVSPATVSFGGVPATAVTVTGSTTITATAPAGTGTADVSVATALGSSTLTGAYAYEPVPTVASLSPAVGPSAGGTAVTITGTGFTPDAAVQFGTVPASSVTVSSATSLTAVSPAGTAGTVDVTVTTAGGTSATTNADAYSYADVPTITSVSPDAGSTSGGTSVDITGTGFTQDADVHFGSIEATGVTVIDSTSLTAFAPTSQAGTVDITVTTPGGTSALSSADQYTFADVPTVVSISPSAGPVAGGTVVTVTGSNFVAGDTSVQFGATSAGVIVASDTSLTAVSPAASAGVVDITVTTPGGTSATSSADQFTYDEPLSITPTDSTYTEVGVNYSQANPASGGFGTDTYSVASGAVPAGTTIDTATGTVSGTPTTSGAFSYTVQVTDQAADTATTTTVTGTIAPALGLAATPSTGSEVGVAYSQTNDASGGTAPYVYSVSAGTVPAGTTLNASTGTVSGMPTAAGPFSYTVTATDADGATAIASSSGVVDAQLTLTPFNSLSPQQDGPYVQTNTAAGGDGPYTFSVVAGALPSGTSLDTSTGTVSGTTDTQGFFSYTIQVTDQQGATVTAQTSGVVQPNLSQA